MAAGRSSPAPWRYVFGYELLRIAAQDRDFGDQRLVQPGAHVDGSEP